MTTLPREYGAWRLASPDDPDGIGTEPGQPCNRIEEPDEDAPRGYRPKACKGEMITQFGATFCGICGEMA